MAPIEKLANGEVHEDFEGTVLRVDSDGFGYVEITKPANLTKKVGVFTSEVLSDPKVSRGVKKGRSVSGRIAEKSGGLRVLKLDGPR